MHGKAPDVGLARPDRLRERGALAVSGGEQEARQLVHSRRRYWWNSGASRSDSPGMSCTRIRHAVSARLDGEDPGIEPASIDAHLDSCAACRAFADGAARMHRTAAPCARARDARPHAGHPRRHRSRGTGVRAQRRHPARAPVDPRAARAGADRRGRPRADPRVRRRRTRAHRAPPRLVRRRGGGRVPVRGLAPVPDPRAPARRRRAGRVPGRFVAARRAVRQHRGARRGAPRDRLRRARGGLAAQPRRRRAGPARAAPREPGLA